MSELIVNESCSCGASIRVLSTNYRSADGGGSPGNGTHRSAEEVAERWWKEHRHEFKPGYRLRRKPEGPSDA